MEWSVNGMVRGDSLTLVREWKKIYNKEFKIYNPGILLFLTIEFGAEFG